MDIDTENNSSSEDKSNLNKKKLVPWVEKYRPAKVDEVSHQDEVLKTLKTSLEQGNLPHLLFHGPPGKHSIDLEVINFIVNFILTLLL